MEVLVPGTEKVGRHWSKGFLLDFHSLMWSLYFTDELGSPCFDVVMTWVLESLERQVCRWVYPLWWPRVHSYGAILEKFVEPGSSDFEALLSPEFICEDPVLWLEVMCWCEPGVGPTSCTHFIYTVMDTYQYSVFQILECFHFIPLIYPESSSNLLSVDSYSSLSGSILELPVHILLSVYAILSISFLRSARW